MNRNVWFCIDCIGQSWHTSNAPVRNEDEFMRGGGKGGGGGSSQNHEDYFSISRVTKNKISFSRFLETQKRNKV